MDLFELVDFVVDVITHISQCNENDMKIVFISVDSVIDRYKWILNGRT